MGLFDRFKKKQNLSFETDRPAHLENQPHMLSAKLLFFDKPKVDPVKILEELKLHFNRVDNPGTDKALIYYFPDIQINLQDASIPAQCTVLIPDEDNLKVEIADEAFQQNWGWQEANEFAANCKYEVLVSDLMTSALDYKTRVDLFTCFLAVVTKVANPQIVYSLTSQQLLDPANVVSSIASKSDRRLESLVNVRLYNISNGESGELLMDTIGLHLLGLPDFQIRFSGLQEAGIAGLLWSYAYFIFEQGNIIETGNTLPGLAPHSKWKCERQVSLIAPERVVINVQPV